MLEPTSGVHHVTAIASDPAENVRFYTDTLGLRLIKRSVNQDDATVYHLFYGDHKGSPGTSMTFFPYTDTRSGRVGTGQVYATQFLVPAASIEYWQERLESFALDVRSTERFSQSILAFTDPDGLKLEIVGVEDAPDGHPPNGPVPAEHAIRGFHGVALAIDSPGRFPSLLERFGYEEVGTDDERTRYVAEGPLGPVVDLHLLEGGPRGRPGAGTVHHVAFAVGDNDQTEWREQLIDAGLRPTEIIDRKWFKSVYTRTPAGILFEFATPSPGYTVDEPLESLGEELVLPDWLEPQREKIERVLPEIPEPGF